ncbi:DUF302 domain-containing protein [Roseovarius amoyensis]|uniref:DUF302 domain-containing protein n=1 Tax=Roseovarius amoyensis TaxID=2211448 RepID=UPI000DBE2290|nr:DUF302 domain-containing protein [Roseovarius amoyensis]
MKTLITAATVAFLAAPVMAQSDDIVKVPASGNVEATADRLEAAIDNAGATVAARVDHGAAAATVDMGLHDAQLLIFGNPKIGTPAMQDDALAGLFLPLKVLVYEDGEGQVWLAYEDPAAMSDRLDGISADAPYLERMQGALRALTSAAASE